MKNTQKGALTNIIPKGDNWATMPIGVMSRIMVHFLQLPKQPPKYAAPLLVLLCEKIQKSSLYGEGEQIGVEVSSRQLVQELTSTSATKLVHNTTINNALNWLVQNEWIVKDTGKDKKHKTVITINLDRIKGYLTPAVGEPTLNYDCQTQEWQTILNRIENKE